MPKLFHGTLLQNLPEILTSGIEVSEGWGGANTSGAFLSGTPEGALYWAQMAYQREQGEKLEIYKFDRDHGHEVDHLLAVVAVEIPEDETGRLMADQEQFEDVHARFDPTDWRESLKAIGDVRFDGPIPPNWVTEVIRPSSIPRGGRLGDSDDDNGMPTEFRKKMNRILKRRLIRHKYAKDLVDPQAIAVCLYQPTTEQGAEKWYTVTPGFPYDEGAWRVAIWDREGPIRHYSSPESGASYSSDPFLTVLQAVDDVLFSHRQARVIEYILPSGEHVRVGRGPSCF
jgi:hypothetical protein